MKSFAWALVQCGWCPCRKGNPDKDVCKGKTTGHEEKAGGHKPRREASEEASPADTFVLDF